MSLPCSAFFLFFFLSFFTQSLVGITMKENVVYCCYCRLSALFFLCDRSTDRFVAWHFIVFIELMYFIIYSIVLTKAFYLLF